MFGMGESEPDMLVIFLADDDTDDQPHWILFAQHCIRMRQAVCPLAEADYLFLGIQCADHLPCGND